MVIPNFELSNYAFIIIGQFLTFQFFIFQYCDSNTRHFSFTYTYCSFNFAIAKVVTLNRYAIFCFYVQCFSYLALSFSPPPSFLGGTRKGEKNSHAFLLDHEKLIQRMKQRGEEEQLWLSQSWRSHNHKGSNREKFRKIFFNPKSHFKRWRRFHKDLVLKGSILGTSLFQAIQLTKILLVPPKFKIIMNL